MNLFRAILDIVFPVNCVSCGKSGSDLCLACLLDSPPAERESADWIFPLFDYRHPPVKKSVWLLKYKSKKRIAGIFAEALYGRMLEELSDLSALQNFREPILVPIPLSPKRFRERGYNQAELICQELIKLDEKSEENFKLEKNVLVKIKETEHQVKIKDRKDRLKNLSGSFAVKNGELVKGRNIILIDDVSTTGATLNEARRTLKQSGAKKVIAFTLAH